MRELRELVPGAVAEWGREKDLVAGAESGRALVGDQERIIRRRSEICSYRRCQRRPP